jgi:hypothetical protein
MKRENKFRKKNKGELKKRNGGEKCRKKVKRDQFLKKNIVKSVGRRAIEKASEGGERESW